MADTMDDDMVERSHRPWEVEFLCPFCSEVIVTACDHSLFPDDITTDEVIDILCVEPRWDSANGYCEHLAFVSEWAYAGHTVPDEWEQEMAVLATALAQHGVNRATDRMTLPGLAETLADRMSDHDCAEVDRLIGRLLPHLDHKVIEEYVEKWDGLGTAGLTYRLIFLRMR